LAKGLLDLLEPIGLDDCDDELHRVSRFRIFRCQDLKNEPAGVPPVRMDFNVVI